MVEKKKFSVKGFESANQKLRIAPLPNLLGWKQKCKFLQNRNLSNDQQTLFCQNIIYNLPNKSTSEKKDTGFVLLFWLWYQHLFCRRAKNLRRFRNLNDQLAEQKTFVDNVEAVADLRRLHFSKTCTWNLNLHCTFWLTRFLCLMLHLFLFWNSKIKTKLRNVQWNARNNNN